MANMTNSPPAGGPPGKTEPLKVLPYEDAKHTLAEQNAYIKSNHQGLGWHATGWGIAFNVALHMLAYVPTLLCFVGTVLGGYWTWLTFIAGWVLVPLFDMIIGADSYNLTEEEEKVWEKSIWFRAVTWVHLPSQISILTFCCWWITSKDITTLEWIGITMSVGTAQGFGIGCVHELIHRPDTYDFMNGIISLCFSSYGHFWIEHLWCHHRNVSTPLDCASSDVGDISWFFVPKCMFTTACEAWAMEQKIAKFRGYHPLNPVRNRFIMAWIVTGMIATSYYLMFGSACLSFFFTQGIIASYIVDNTNYVEHYGLRRREIRPGVYERVNWLHAWDTPDMLTNVMLFKIQRHPDHHTNAQRPYQILRTYKDAPTLPTGYAGCIVLSWFPPLWRKVMDWRVDLVREQQEELRLKGTVRGEKKIFPDGARAVASHCEETDKFVLGKESVGMNGEKLCPITAKEENAIAPSNDLGGLQRVDDEREHVAARWALLIGLIAFCALLVKLALANTLPGRLPELVESVNNSTAVVQDLDVMDSLSAIARSLVRPKAEL